MDLLKKIHEFKCKISGHEFITISTREIDEIVSKNHRVVKNYLIKRCISCGEVKIEFIGKMIKPKVIKCTCIVDFCSFKISNEYVIFSKNDKENIYIVEDHFGNKLEFPEELFEFCFEIKED